MQHDILRDCTSDEKDALLVFLIGFFLGTHGNKKMMLTEEMVEQSIFRARLPAYDTAFHAYLLKTF